MGSMKTPFEQPHIYDSANESVMSQLFNHKQHQCPKSTTVSSAFLQLGTIHHHFNHEVFCELRSSSV